MHPRGAQCRHGGDCCGNAKLAQKLIAFAETDNHDEKAFETASNELAIAWQQVSTIGVRGVVITLKHAA